MPGFDVEAARKAGATDEQIVQFLRDKNPSFDVDGAIQAGASPKQIADFLAVNASPPHEQPKSVMDSIAAKSVDRFGNSLLAGWGDRAAAALAAPIVATQDAIAGRKNPGLAQTYKEILDARRSAADQFKQDSPLAYYGSNLAGAAAGAYMLPGSSPSRVASIASKLTSAGSRSGAAQLAARMAEGAALGGVYGAINTAGDSRADTIPELLKAGAVGGATGAVTGASIPVVMEGMRKLAEGGMAYATKISPRDRAFGKTPEAAALQYTEGATPTKILDSAEKAIDTLANRNKRLAKGSTADIGRAQNYIQAAANRAGRRQDTQTASTLREMADFLTKPVQGYSGGVSNGAISKVQNGADAVALKQDFSNMFLSWNPDKKMTDTAERVARNTYRMLDKSVDKISPEIARNNQTISSLIPVKRGADMASRLPGVGQNLFQRATAMTGASLAGAGGLHYLGVPIVPAVAAAVTPALLAQPEVAAGGARALYGMSQSAPLQDLTRYILSQSARPFYQK